MKIIAFLLVSFLAVSSICSGYDTIVFAMKRNNSIAGIIGVFMIGFGALISVAIYNVIRDRISK